MDSNPPTAADLAASDAWEAREENRRLEQRVSILENDLRKTMQALVKLKRQCAALLPIENFE